MSDAKTSLLDPLVPSAPTESERARIRELIKKLKPSALKYLSTELPSPSTTRTNFYEILIDPLKTTDDKHWRERTVAAWGIGFANIPEENGTRRLRFCAMYSPTIGKANCLLIGDG